VAEKAMGASLPGTDAVRTLRDWAGMAAILTGLYLANSLAHLAQDRGAIRDGEWWRLFTGSLVHTDPGHLLLNLAGLLFVMLLFAEQLPARRLAVAGLLITPAIGLAVFLFEPHTDRFAGLSGLLHGLFALGAGMLWKTDRRASLALLLLLLSKLVLERHLGPVSRPILPATANVAYGAHAWGSLFGTLLAVVLHSSKALRRIRFA